MKRWQEEYLARYYYSIPGWKGLDGHWRELLSTHVPRGAKVLEVGPGPFEYPCRHLAEIAGSLTGLDVDPAVTSNQALHEAYVYDGRRFPFSDNTFQVVVSRWVHEHLENPQEHCREVRRVLACGGKYIFRTPNLLHYVGMVSHVTPQWFHNLVAHRLRGYPPDDHAPYPTCYRFNTLRCIRRLLLQERFTVESLHGVEGHPNYGMASRFLFIPFMWYERLVNSSKSFECLRHTLDCVARRDDKGTQA